MAGNPNVSLGALNRLLSSATFATFPQLNVTASFLARPGIRLSFTGAATILIDAMTGVVTSPEPYVQFLLELHMLKSQGFADTWKRQIENNTVLGALTVRSDSPVLSPYRLGSASILTPADPLDFSGASAEFAVRVGGTYQINNSLWP